MTEIQPKTETFLLQFSDPSYFCENLTQKCVSTSLARPTVLLHLFGNGWSVSLSDSVGQRTPRYVRTFTLSLENITDDILM